MNQPPVTDYDLHSYVDCELDPSRQAAVGHYVKGNADLAKRVEAYRWQRDALHAIFKPIENEPTPRQLNLASLMEKHHRAWFQKRWIAAVAILVFCAGVTSGWLVNEFPGVSSRDITALAQEAMDSYQVFAPDQVRPVEIQATERAQLIRWASRRLSHAVTVPDLSTTGFRFLGGRLIPTPHGAAVLLMYDNDHGTRLSLLSRSIDEDGNEPGAARARGKVFCFTWAKGGVGYSLVGTVSFSALQLIAKETRSQLDRSGADVNMSMADGLHYKRSS